LFANGRRGMTPNPTFFEHAVGHTSDYDKAFTALAHSERTDRDIFETLAIREAADLFRTVCDSTAGGCGFASLEISQRVTTRRQQAAY
jgi:transaldolase